MTYRTGPRAKRPKGDCGRWFYCWLRRFPSGGIQLSLFLFPMDSTRPVRAKLAPLVLVDVGLECTDVGKIPVALVVVQAVPHDEGRRDREPVVTDVQRDLLDLGLCHQGADLEAPRLAALQVLEQVGERQ